MLLQWCKGNFGLVNRGRFDSSHSPFYFGRQLRKEIVKIICLHAFRNAGFPKYQSWIDLPGGSIQQTLM